MSARTIFIKVFSLFMVMLILISMISCNTTYNRPGKTTDTAVESAKKQVEKKGIIESEGFDSVEDCIALLLTYQGLNDMYYKWYDKSQLTHLNSKPFYGNFVKSTYTNKPTVTFYYNFKNAEFSSKMNDVIPWAEEYINSLDLEIKVSFKYRRNGNYNGSYNYISDVCPKDADMGYGSEYQYWDETTVGLTYTDRDLCDIKSNSLPSINDIAFNVVSIAFRPDQFARYGDSMEKYEMVFLHEIGHALGLSDVYEKAVSADLDDFLGQTVMYPYEQDDYTRLYKGHAAYFTLDYAALELLYN